MKPILIAEELKKYFGNVKAVDNVSFEIYPREIIGLIGPNGAGKTTLLNLLSGILRPNKGKILLYTNKSIEYINIAGWNPAKINKLGVARAFQIPNIFEGMTVIDNIRAAFIANRSIYTKIYKFYYKIDSVERNAYNLLNLLGLYEKRNYLAKNLGHGERKILDIALALTMHPKIILLDEPTAGLSAIEKPLITNLIRKLKEKFNVALLIVEHDLDVVFNISDRVIVMHEGKILTEGNPAEIENDKRVIEAYFGEST